MGQRVKQNPFHMALHPIPGAALVLDPLQNIEHVVDGQFTNWQVANEWVDVQVKPILR